MRPARTLRTQARARAQARRMNELDRVVREHIKPDPARPETFHATSGDSRSERAPERWMPHDYQPIVGFRPNT